MGAIKGKEHLIYRGKEVFRRSSIMLLTVRVRCSVTFAEGMIAPLKQKF